MKIFAALILAIFTAGCAGDNCLPPCADLGWDGSSPLVCTGVHEPRVCAMEGVRCVPDPKAVVCQ